MARTRQDDEGKVRLDKSKYRKAPTNEGKIYPVTYWKGTSREYTYEYTEFELQLLREVLEGLKKL